MTKYLRYVKLRIKRRDCFLFDSLYRMFNLFRQISIPHNRVIHSFLYSEWTGRLSSWHGFWRILYYEPMFKPQCARVGKNFRMEYAGNGSAKIFGNLILNIGNNVLDGTAATIFTFGLPVLYSIISNNSFNLIAYVSIVSDFACTTT